MDELSIEDLDHVIGGGGHNTYGGKPAGGGNGTGGGDGLGWLRGLVRNVFGGVVQNAGPPAIQHENVHAS